MWINDDLDWIWKDTVVIHWLETMSFYNMLLLNVDFLLLPNFYTELPRPTYLRGQKSNSTALGPTRSRAFQSSLPRRYLTSTTVKPASTSSKDKPSTTVNIPNYQWMLFHESFDIIHHSADQKQSQLTWPLEKVKRMLHWRDCEPELVIATSSSSTS